MYSSESSGGGSSPFAFNTSRIVKIVVGLFLLLFLVRNAFTKDYSNETKSYLTKIGREDAIDQVVPKTRKVCV